MVAACGVVGSKFFPSATGALTSSGLSGDSAKAVSVLAPHAEMTFFPWKDTKEKIPLAVRHVRTFLKANRPD